VSEERPTPKPVEKMTRKQLEAEAKKVTDRTPARPVEELMDGGLRSFVKLARRRREKAVSRPSDD
jgi:hypothetical protein